jgi:hypothetical protein
MRTGVTKLGVGKLGVGQLGVTKLAVEQLAGLKPAGLNLGGMNLGVGKRGVTSMVGALAGTALLAGCAAIMPPSGPPNVFAGGPFNAPFGHACQGGPAAPQIGGVAAPGGIPAGQTPPFAAAPPCQPPMFQAASYPHVAAMPFGNLSLGHLVGAAIDAASAPYPGALRMAFPQPQPPSPIASPPPSPVREFPASAVVQTPPPGLQNSGF